MEIKTPITETGILELNEPNDGIIPGLLSLGAMLRTATSDENGMRVARTDSEGKKELTAKLNETVQILAANVAALGALLGMVDGDEIAREVPILGWLLHDLGRTIDILENNRAVFSLAK